MTLVERPEMPRFRMYRFLGVRWTFLPGERGSRRSRMGRGEYGRGWRRMEEDGGGWRSMEEYGGVWRNMEWDVEGWSDDPYPE